MGISNISFTGSYLENLPLNKIMKHPGSSTKGGIHFTGYPQQHPTERNKLILVSDPLGENPAVLEFKLDDVLYIEETKQAVTIKGEGIPMVKLWIRKGARGMLLEHFEVSDSLDFVDVRRELRERFAKQ